MDTYALNNTCVRACPDGNYPTNGVCPTNMTARGIGIEMEGGGIATRVIYVLLLTDRNITMNISD